MNKIVYLFGAGASIGALPTRLNMKQRIHDFIEEISQSKYELSDSLTFQDINAAPYQTKREHQIDLINGLKELEEACDKHYSVDTFAKKLWIREDHKGLKKLKALLSFFFTIEQIRRRPDSRYDFFFASLLNSIDKFPQNVRILTWNYDIQFEYAYSEYTQKKFIEEIQTELHVYKKAMPHGYYNDHGFCIFKINGSTDFYISANPDNVSMPLIYEIISETDLTPGIFEHVVRMYVTNLYSREIVSNFSFAWEEIKYQDFLKKVHEHVSSADILVIIGYSLPYFNRSVDRTIIQSIKNLSKVYIQAPDAKEIIERFQSIGADINPKNIIPITDTDYFFIPNEM